jgi:hypothetical protein
VKIDNAIADLGVEIIIRHKCCPTSEKLRELVAHLFEERECIPLKELQNELNNCVNEYDKALKKKRRNKKKKENHKYDE